MPVFAQTPPTASPSAGACPVRCSHATNDLPAAWHALSMRAVTVPKRPCRSLSPENAIYGVFATATDGTRPHVYDVGSMTYMCHIWLNVAVAARRNHGVPRHYGMLLYPIPSNAVANSLLLAKKGGVCIMQGGIIRCGLGVVVSDVFLLLFGLDLEVRHAHRCRR
jgi:hypothetical protein